jgi:predicted  nucleic acid-binding Zn-ribbon protein
VTWIVALVGLACGVLSYTVTITLSYSKVVTDIAVIRTMIEERTGSSKEELVRLREELNRNREEIAALRVMVETLRNELHSARVTVEALRGRRAEDLNER